MQYNWQVHTLINAIEAKMAGFGENIAEFPIAITKERDVIPWWVVNIHVKVKRTTEFDIEVQDHDLVAALKKALTALGKENVLVGRAKRSNALYNVTV